MNAKTATAIAMLFTVLATMSCKAEGIVDEWATQGYSARVRIAPCLADSNLFCGTITWLWDPTDDSGAPMIDRNNPSRELQQRPLIGLNLLHNFRAVDATHWADGSIYDPESGRTYKSSLRLKSPDLLEVSGCVLFFCQTQIWRRASSVCANARQ